MAGQQHDREDLLQEATALVERAELSLPGFEESIVLGFRAGGAVSVFFGGERVYQFNTAGELRRAFRGGRMIKAVGGRLVELTRHRAAGQVQLLRQELDAAAQSEVLADCRQGLARLQWALEAGRFQRIGQSPADADVVGRMQSWLQALPPSLAVADRPNVA